MIDGLYAVEFRTNNDHGNGIISITDGSINGGDSGYYYQGKLTQDGKSMKLKLAVRQYVAGFVSAFGTIGQFTLELEGREHDDEITIQLHGNVEGAFEQKINITAKRIQPLV